MANNRKTPSRSLLLLLLLLLFVFGVIIWFIIRPAPQDKPPPSLQPVGAEPHYTPPPEINGYGTPSVSFKLPPLKKLPPVELAPEPQPKVVAAAPERAPQPPPPTATRAARPAVKRYMPPPPPRRTIATENTQFIVRRKLLAGGQTYTNGTDTLTVPARHYIECTGTTDMQNYYFEIDTASYQRIQNGLMYHVENTKKWRALPGMPSVEPPPPGYTRIR